MKHAFLVILNANGKYGVHELYMPWLFTTMEEACKYGEYKFRLGDTEKYRILRLDKPYPFYALK